jgi:hypothetical protein
MRRARSARQLAQFEFFGKLIGVALRTGNQVRCVHAARVVVCACEGKE